MKLTVNRLSGTDRYQTVLEIAKYFVGSQPEAFQYAALQREITSRRPGGRISGSQAQDAHLPGQARKGRNRAKSLLKGLNLKKYYVFGGQGAVPDSVKKSSAVRSEQK
jgi:hypothetical protein